MSPVEFPSRMSNGTLLCSLPRDHIPEAGEDGAGAACEELPELHGVSVATGTAGGSLCHPPGLALLQHLQGRAGGLGRVGRAAGMGSVGSSDPAGVGRAESPPQGAADLSTCWEML